MKSNSQLGMTNIHLTAIWLYPIDVQQDTRVLFPQFVPGIPCLELLELLSTRLGQSGAKKNIDSVCSVCSTSQETKECHVVPCSARGPRGPKVKEEIRKSRNCPGAWLRW